MMDAWSLVLDVSILLGAALLAGIVFGRLRQNAIVGYLLTGVLLGPAGFGLLRGGEAIAAIAELGVALLLFAIGLEFSWTRLRRFGALALGGGTLQVTVTLALFFGLSSAIGLSVTEALVLGAAAALSSTAVVMRVLTDRGELDSMHGRIALGILLLQDVAVVPLVLLVSALTGGGLMESLSVFGLALLQGAGLVAGLIVVCRYLLPRLLLAASSFQNRDLPILLAFAVFLLAAVASHMLGLSPILGTFIAGMLLAETPFADQIRADVTPMRAIFVTVFFASVGMLVRMPSVSEALTAVGIAIAIVTGKALVIALVVRLFRQQARPAWRAAFSLAQIGEFSFVLAEVAHKNELISDSIFQVLLSASLITLLATPYLIELAPRIANWLTRAAKVQKPMELPPDAAEKRVVVVGLGPAGREVVAALQERDYPVFVLELNPATVAANRSQFPIGLGDATQRDILDHVHLSDAAALVVTIPDPHAARQIVRQARAAAPDLPIMVRARQHFHAASLSRAGATDVFDEEYLIGRRMAGKAVESISVGETPRKKHE